MQPLKIIDLTGEMSGKQVWAIGDIHGEYDLFRQLLEKVNYREETHIIVSVGDMIDRGPNSPAVVKWFSNNGYAVLGNHEDMWLQTIKGVSYPYEGQVLNEKWLQYNFGGGLGANGMDLTLHQFMDGDVLAETWLGYFEGLPHGIIVGDWLILHGGVNPEKSFDKQDANEVLWMRDEFLEVATPPESRTGKRLIVGHNETFWLGAVGEPVFREDAVFIDIGTANGLALGAFCLDTGEFLMVKHQDFEKNSKRISSLIEQGMIKTFGDDFR